MKTLSILLVTKPDSKLALGTVQFGIHYGVANARGQTTRKEADEIINLAREAGINTLDTAISYGESEQVLGELVVKDFQVITKIPPLLEDLENVDDWINNQINKSLQRLRIPALWHGVLLHRSESLHGKTGEQVVKSLERLKSSGLVKKIGISIYNPSELEFANQVMPLDLVQVPLNVLDRRLESSGWLVRLHSLRSGDTLPLYFFTGAIVNAS